MWPIVMEEAAAGAEAVTAEEAASAEEVIRARGPPTRQRPQQSEEFPSSPAFEDTSAKYSFGHVLFPFYLFFFFLSFFLLIFLIFDLILIQLELRRRGRRMGSSSDPIRIE